FPTTPPPSQQKALSMDSWGRTTMTCVPPLAVRAFIRTLRDKTERSESASTELVYSISRSHSPNHTRSGHTTLSKNLHESDCIAGHRKCTAMPPSKRGHRKQTFIRQPFTYENLQTSFMLHFNGASDRRPGRRRCCHRMEFRRARRHSHQPHGPTYRLSQSRHCSRFNLRRSQWYRPHV